MCKKPGMKDYIFCDFIYVKCLKQANPQRPKVDEWLPEVYEDVLEFDRGHGHAKLFQYITNH